MSEYSSFHQKYISGARGVKRKRDYSDDTIVSRPYKKTQQQKNLVLFIRLVIFIIWDKPLELQQDILTHIQERL